MNKITEALKLAGKALGCSQQHLDLYHPEWVITRQQNDKALAAIREALAEQPTVLEDPHPPHRLCECTACLEYWTPLPDCDAFAAPGKPIDHIADTGKMVADPVKQEPVAWWEFNEDIGAWFLAYTFNPKAKTRPLIFGDAAPVQPVKQEPVFNADDLYSIAGRLALELECLLMDTKDMSVVSKWWDSAHEALEQWRSFHSAPVQPVKQEPVHEALQIASVALQDIACSSQTENLYWWQLRARKAQKQIAERLTIHAPVQPLKQEPVAWHEPGSYGNVTTHKIWAMKNGWLPLYPKEQE